MRSTYAKLQDVKLQVREVAEALLDLRVKESNIMETKLHLTPPSTFVEFNYDGSQEYEGGILTIERKMQGGIKITVGRPAPTEEDGRNMDFQTVFETNAKGGITTFIGQDWIKTFAIEYKKLKDEVKAYKSGKEDELTIYLALLRK